MSPKGKGAAAEPEPAEEVTAQEISEELQDILSSLGQDGGKVQVFRRRMGGRKMYIRTVYAAELRDDPLAWLLSEHGGGTYTLRIKDGKGRYIKGGHHDVDIEGPERPWPREDDGDGDPEDDGAPDHEGDPEELLALLEERMDARLREARTMSTGDLLRELRRDLRDLVREVRTPPPQAAQADPASMALSLVQAVQAATAPLMEALLERRDERSTVGDQVDTLAALLSIARDLGGKGEEGYMPVVREVARPLGRLIDHHVDTQIRDRDGTPRGAALATQPNPPVTRPAWYPHLAPFVPTMLDWAARDRDPELRADLVIEELTDEQLGPIYETVNGDGFEAEFLATVPQASPYQQWFSRFFGRVRSGIAPADGEIVHRAEEPPSV